MHRCFLEIHDGTATPIAAEAWLRIGMIYTIERETARRNFATTSATPTTTAPMSFAPSTTAGDN